MQLHTTVLTSMQRQLPPSVRADWPGATRPDAWQRFLDTDLRHSSHPVLPPMGIGTLHQQTLSTATTTTFHDTQHNTNTNNTNTSTNINTNVNTNLNTNLNNKKSTAHSQSLILQLVDAVDVSVSLYQQLLAIREQRSGEKRQGRRIVVVSNNNDNDGPSQLPQPPALCHSEHRGNSSLFKLTLTDGHSLCFAMEEYSPIKALSVNLPVGTKIRIHQATVLRGMIMLTPRNTTILGGLVPELAVIDRETRLCRALGIDLPNPANSDSPPTTTARSSTSVTENSSSRNAASSSQRVPSRNNAVQPASSETSLWPHTSVPSSHQTVSIPSNTQHSYSTTSTSHQSTSSSSSSHQPPFPRTPNQVTFTSSTAESLHQSNVTISHTTDRREHINDADHVFFDEDSWEIDDELAMQAVAEIEAQTAIPYSTNTVYNNHHHKSRLNSYSSSVTISGQHNFHGTVSRDSSVDPAGLQLGSRKVSHLSTSSDINSRPQYNASCVLRDESSDSDLELPPTISSQRTKRSKSVAVIDLT